MLSNIRKIDDEKQRTMSKKVFISSTFLDLQEYRLAVQYGIRQLGLEDIAMEHLGARDERPNLKAPHPLF